MKLQRWQILACAIGMVAVGGQVALAIDGQPSRSALEQMGLGGMTVISDSEAMAVRGLGFKSGSSVQVSGNSFATINTPFGSAHSENAYAAQGKNKAGGDNFSFAGFAVTTSHPKPGNGGNGGYGGMPGNGGNGGYGGMPGNGCSNCNNPPPGGGGYGGMAGNGGGGYGGGGSKTTTTSFTVFAGGFSHAYAH